MTLTIKRVATIEECRQIEILQHQIWGGDVIDVVPDHILITFVKNQGMALLALENDHPVGFCYSFLGQTSEGMLKHCSHQAGVLPNIQASGVGYALKVAQREAVLERGLNIISWTFDPMMGLNANLNIGKLGAISHTYYENLYGDMRTEINVGLDSDRLEVQWRLNSPNVLNKLNNAEVLNENENISTINMATRNRDGNHVPPNKWQPFTENKHYILLPDNIQTIKETDLPLTQAWQVQIRTLFQAAFAQGYIIADFIWHRDQGLGYYLLTKETPYYEN
ncbi:MAG: hypothetical protein AAF629_28675 [Chloroflexota bacterium]